MFSLDISTIGIVLSIIFAIIFSESIIRNIVGNVLLVVRAIHDHQQEYCLKAALQEAADSKGRVDPSHIKSLSEISEKDYSDMERSLCCNITLFFWFLMFSLVLIFATSQELSSLSQEQMLMSLVYIAFLAYLFKPIWILFDRRFSSDPFLSKLQTKTAALRYPVLYVWGVLTFNQLFKDYAGLSREWITIVALVFFTFFLANIALRIYRVYSLNVSEFKLFPHKKDSSLYFLGIAAETFAFFVSLVLALAVVYVLKSYVLVDEHSVDVQFWLVVMPFFSLLVPLYTFWRVFKFKRMFNFLFQK